MMGRQQNDQAQFFYSFHFDERVPTGTVALTSAV
jgi:hypothetical protein